MTATNDSSTHLRRKELMNLHFSWRDQLKICQPSPFVQRWPRRHLAKIGISWQRTT